MAETWSKALLAAVVSDITAANLKSATNGERLVWRPVAKAMLLLGAENAVANKWRNRHGRINAEEAEIMAARYPRTEEYRQALATVIAEVRTSKQDKPKDDHKETPAETIERIRREAEMSDEEAVAVAEREIEYEKLKARAKVAERLAAEYRKKAAFVQDACGLLRDIVVTMPPAQWNRTEIPAVHIRREQDAVLVLSDIHVGDAIHADTMGAINVYNYDVFKQKAKRLYAGVRESLEMLREHGNVRKLWVLGLGDWVTGTNIFPGQAHHIEFGAMKQAMNGAEEMTRLLYEFLELPGIDEVQAECVPGNHGRPGKKGQDPFEDNWDLVLYEFMRLRLGAQPRLSVKWHESWWMMPRIRGWDFLCAHGDEVRAWNGIPNYGFRRWGQKWREMLDSVGKRYDYGLIGHHHTEVEERNLIISGAWPGASFFSAKFLQSGGEATQMFYSVSEDYGITWRRRLPLDPSKRVVTEQSAS